MTSTIRASNAASETVIRFIAVPPGAAVSLQRAAIMADGKLVTAADLDLQEGAEDDPDVLNLKSARERADRKVIRHALARSEGNISSTARLLGISRPTLYDLLKQYDLHA